MASAALSVTARALRCGGTQSPSHNAIASPPPGGDGGVVVVVGLGGVVAVSFLVVTVAAAVRWSRRRRREDMDVRALAREELGRMAVRGSRMPAAKMVRTRPELKTVAR
ncbi:hypothetical protein ZWY2020_037333 [Hordeum vulgare]|nr:hypothetical protein ZWY2020_037333 [Hordeum vulgare]